MKSFTPRDLKKLCPTIQSISHQKNTHKQIAKYVSTTNLPYPILLSTAMDAIPPFIKYATE
jgi:hypothetical protein